MADNTTLNSGSGGNTFRTLEDGSSIQWPVGVTAFATTVGTPDVLEVVTSTTGLPVRLSDGSGYIATLPVSLASVPSHAVTNAGTFAVQVDGAALTALQLIDNIVLAEDAAHASGDPGVQALAVRRDSAAASAGTDGDYSPLSVDATGRLWCNVANTVAVGSHDVTNAGTFAVQAAQSGTWTVQPGNTANTTAWLVTGTGGTFPVTDSGGSLTVDNAALSVTGGGVEASALRVTLASDSTGVLSVDDNGGALTVDNGGTFAVQESGAALTALQVMDDWDNAASDGASVSGDAAHDAADAGEPVKLGAKATTSLAGLTLVADADRTNLFAGVDGVLVTRPHCNLEDIVQDRATNTDGASTAFAGGLAAPGAGVRLYVKNVTVCNSSASFCTVDLRDGAAGSVLWTLPVPATGGVTHVFDPPLKLTANTALAYDASAATTTLTISANGFKSKV